MKKLLVYAIVMMSVCGISSRAIAEDTSKSADKTPTSYDMKAQSLLDLDDLHKKFVSLANAIPAEKYSWRPAPGVRSVSEVLLHVAAANFSYASELGTMPAAGIKMQGFEQSTTDKANVIEQLNHAFDYAHSAIEKMANIDFKKPIPKYGPDANLGDIVYVIVTHSHEHLGQSIAYARVNGIVPPWTAMQPGQQEK